MRKLSLVAIAGALFVAGCNHTYNTVGAREGYGAAAGGVSGDVIGSQVSEGSGSIVGAPIGAVSGGLIGSEISRQFDERDMQQALAAEYRALEYGNTGQPVVWRNDTSGHRGEVIPGPGYRVNSADCRDYRHTIYIQGRAQTGRGTACRRPDGTWRTVT